MALGYETTGTGPNIIANAGNAMAADIRRIGEVIRKDIQQHNQDKQVFGFLQEAKTLNPESSSFPKDLVGVFAKYPSAAGDQRALTGAKFLHDAWEQKQLKDKLTTQFENQKTIAGIRAGGANRLYGGLGGSDMANGDMNTVMGGSPEPGFNFSAGGPMGQKQSPLGVPFSAPDLPATGGAEGENPLFLNSNLDRSLKRIGVDERTGKRLMAQDAAAQARAARGTGKPITKNVTGVGLVEYDPETQTWNTAVEAKTPRRFRDAGDRLIDLDTNEEVPKGIPPGQREALDMRRSAADVAKSEKMAARALNSINKEIDEKERDITSLETSIRKRSVQKDRTPADDKEMAEWQAKHVELRAQRDILQKERAEIGTVKQLDRDTAAELLKEAGGDKDKARELAKQRGYSL